MSKPKLNDLKLFLDDLLRERSSSDPANKKTRREALLLLPNGETYLTLFSQKRDTLNSMPAALLGLPLVDILKRTDALHDGFGRFVYYMTEAYKHHPTIGVDIVAIAEDLQESFIPDLSVLTASYADEASRAKELRPLLNEKKGLFEKFPVVGGITLMDAATKHIESGEKLLPLLSERSEATDVDRSGVAQLMNSTLGLVRRCRESIVDAIAAKPGLPADLSRQIFGLLDDLTQRRPQHTSAAAAVAAAPTEGKEPPKA